MTQMYRVDFHVHYEDIIDMGSALICASDNASAIDFVCSELALPRSCTVFTANRVKPSIYQLYRREVLKHAAQRARADIDNEDLPSSARRSVVFEVKVAACIKALTEFHAWRKLADLVTDRASSSKPIYDSKVTNFEMTCDRADFRPRESAIEKQSVYLKPQFFQGGMARPR